jgi:predicted AAA+ superfamily ATPase
MLARKLDDFIERHYANNKSALLLKGARQVGKTSAIREFAKRHKMNLITYEPVSHSYVALGEKIVSIKVLYLC